MRGGRVNGTGGVNREENSGWLNKGGVNREENGGGGVTGVGGWGYKQEWEGGNGVYKTKITKVEKRNVTFYET